MTLGFIETQSKFIFIGSKAQGSPWYFWNKEAESAAPIMRTCLNCTLINLEIIHKEFKGKTYPKLVITVNAAGENYKLATGLETWFAKTVVIRLAQLDPIALTAPIYIHAKQGENDGNVIFGYLQNAQQEWVKKPEGFDYKTYDEVAIAEHVYKIVEKLKSAPQQPWEIDPETGEVMTLENMPF